MTLYETTRDEIYDQLSAVTDGGRIFKSVRYTTDWASWFALYANEEHLLKVCWFSKVAHDDSINAPLADFDAGDFIHHTQMSEQWRIEMYYGFKDDDNTPSEFDAQLLFERVETQFRFLQTLNGVCYQSLPLVRVRTELFEFQGGVLCHRAEWVLKLLHRIENPN